MLWCFATLLIPKWLIKSKNAMGFETSFRVNNGETSWLMNCKKKFIEHAVDSGNSTHLLRKNYDWRIPLLWESSISSKSWLRITLVYVGNCIRPLPTNILEEKCRPSTHPVAPARSCSLISCRELWFFFVAETTTYKEKHGHFEPAPTSTFNPIYQMKLYMYLFKTIFYSFYFHGPPTINPTPDH